MTVIERARELGAFIQQDEKYLALKEAMAAKDADTELNKIIAEFNDIRMKMTENSQKGEASSEENIELSKALRLKQGEIISNDNMARYMAAEGALNETVQMVSQILSAAINGDDPMTYQPSSGCSADGCSSCSGCN